MRSLAGFCSAASRPVVQLSPVVQSPQCLTFAATVHSAEQVCQESGEICGFSKSYLVHVLAHTKQRLRKKGELCSTGDVMLPPGKQGRIY